MRIAANRKGGSRWIIGAGLAGVVLGAAWTTSATGTSQPAPASARLANLDVYSLTERLMSLPGGLKAIEDSAAPFQSELDKLQGELTDLQTKINALPKNDPSYEAMFNEGREKQRRAQQIQGQAEGAVETARARLLIRTYQQVSEAAKVVAAREGYTHIFNSRSESRGIETNSVTIALQEILARPVVVSPAGADVTELVASELKLPPPGAVAPAPGEGVPEAKEPAGGQ